MTEDIYSIYNIDKTKLTRDYINNPLKKTSNGRYFKEYPCKEDIEYLYITLNMRRNDICQFFNMSKSVFEPLIRRYNIKKDQLSALKNSKLTNIKRYGVSNILLVDKFKERQKNTMIKKYGGKSPFSSQEIRDKAKDTIIKRYGVSNAMFNNEVKGKLKKTNIDRYGVEYTCLNPLVKEKIKTTNLERYGTLYPAQTDEIKNKIKDSNLKKYGVEYPLTLDSVKNKRKDTLSKTYGIFNISQKDIDEKVLQILNDKEKLKTFIIDNNIVNGYHLAKVLGVSTACANNYLNRHHLRELFNYYGSSEEKEVSDYINQYYKTENNTRKYLDGKEIDIYIPELKLGIEFNGDYWHNEYGKNNIYHQEKSKLAEEKGIFIYHIFEYEWATKREQILNQLNNLLKVNQEKIYARKCEIREVTNKDKSQFLETNHLQGNDNSSVKLGLYYDDKLVSLMTFCKPRFNKNYEWELSRFCSLAGYNVVGGASKLFKCFIKMYKPKSIISYSNIAHTRGVLYNNLGFVLKEIAKPNYIWSNGTTYFSRYQCQKHKLLEQGFEGMSETDIMHKRGFYRIFDCGNKVWAWNR